MKRCPSCNRNYTDETLLYCLEDGTPLVAADQTTAPTLMMPAEPPPTIAYDAGRVTTPQGGSSTASFGPTTPPPGPMPPGPPPAPQGPPSWTFEAQPKPKRKAWPWIVAGLVLLLVFGGGLAAAVFYMVNNGSNDNFNTNTNRVVNANSNANQRPSPTPKLEITRVYMSLHGGDTPGEEVESFSASDRTVYCIVELNDAQPGARVTSTWTVVDSERLKNQKIGEQAYTTEKLKTFDFHLTNQQDWPPGDYKVDVYLDGELARSVNYEIK
jgi:hypothetical protein